MPRAAVLKRPSRGTVCAVLCSLPRASAPEFARARRARGDLCERLSELGRALADVRDALEGLQDLLDLPALAIWKARAPLEPWQRVLVTLSRAC